EQGREHRHRQPEPHRQEAGAGAVLAPVVVPAERGPGVPGREDEQQQPGDLVGPADARAAHFLIAPISVSAFSYFARRPSRYSLASSPTHWTGVSRLRLMYCSRHFGVSVTFRRVSCHHFTASAPMSAGPTTPRICSQVKS